VNTIIWQILFSGSQGKTMVQLGLVKRCIQLRLA